MAVAHTGYGYAAGLAVPEITSGGPQAEGYHRDPAFRLGSRFTTRGCANWTYAEAERYAWAENGRRLPPVNPDGTVTFPKVVRRTTSR